MGFFQAYIITIILETIILFLILRKQYSNQTIVRNSIIASTITLPFVWFVFPLFGVEYILQISFSEIFALVIEAFIYLKLFQNMNISKAFFISFIANLVSFLAGFML